MKFNAKARVRADDGANARYNSQQAALFACSFRMSAFIENRGEITRTIPGLSQDDRLRLGECLIHTFRNVELVFQGAYEGMLFVWATGEVAFLIMPVEFLLKHDPYELFEGKVHRLARVPDDVVADLYLRKGVESPEDNWLIWDGSALLN